MQWNYLDKTCQSQVTCLCITTQNQNNCLGTLTIAAHATHTYTALPFLSVEPTSPSLYSVMKSVKFLRLPGQPILQGLETGG